MKRKVIRNGRNERICDLVIYPDRTTKIVTKEGRQTKEIDLDEILKAVEHLNKNE